MSAKDGAMSFGAGGMARICRTGTSTACRISVAVVRFSLLFHRREFSRFGQLLPDALFAFTAPYENLNNGTADIYDAGKAVKFQFTALLFSK